MAVPRVITSCFYYTYMYIGLRFNCLGTFGVLLVCSCMCVCGGGGGGHAHWTLLNQGQSYAEVVSSFKAMQNIKPYKFGTS